MSVLTRRDRVALGANNSGALYYGERRRWPLPGVGDFELFATHPKDDRGPGDFFGHCMFALTTWSGGGTTKLYMGYGSIEVNQSPIWIWPLSLDGTWDAEPAHEFVAFGLQHFHHTDDGELIAAGLDGPFDYCIGNADGTWVSGWCSPSGYQHPFVATRHDGYNWVAGQAPTFEGSVWRCDQSDDLGNIGEFVFTSASEVGLNRITCMFSFQDKLWQQGNYVGSQLTYWVEATESWFDTGVNLNDGLPYHIVEWGGMMLMDGPAGSVISFDGTDVATVYGTDVVGVVDLTVDADDNVWLLTGDGFIRRSSDLVDWTVVAEKPGSYSMTVHEGFIYVGDSNDQIWRAVAEV